MNPSDAGVGFQIEGRQNFVGQVAFFNGPQQVAGLNQVAGGRGGDERPFLMLVEPWDLHATRQKTAMILGQIFQWVLQAIVDLPQQTGPQRHREQLAALFHRVANRHASGAFIDLHIGAKSIDPQNLRFQPFLFAVFWHAARQDIDHLVLHQFGQPVRVRRGFDGADIVLDHHHKAGWGWGACRREPLRGGF